MNLSTYGVKWPVTTAMIFLSFIVLGGFAWTQVGIDLMPEIEVPAITVITTYEGAGPQEIESRITELIEDNVATVQNVDEITSISMEGVSAVTVKFEWGVNLDEATNDVRDKLDLVTKRLPDKAENPIIFKFNTSMIPVMVLGVSAEESWEKLDRIVDKKISEDLKRIPGVATTIVNGGDKRGILCNLYRERMEAAGLSGKQIVDILYSQNLNNPGGHIKKGLFEYLIRTPEEFRSVDEIGAVVVAKSPGIVRLRDVAEVKDGFLEKTMEFMRNGRRGVGLMVQKQAGANTVAVCSNVLKALPDIQAQLPADVKIEVFFDSSDFIHGTIKNLSNSLMTGGVIVFLIILFFLQDIVASLIVCTIIPTSLIITFLLMYIAGYTINQITLSSLTIAIGMVVDNAIVVLDNVKRYIERGVSVRESSIWGSVEMGTSLMASTLTTIVIFLPIIFTSGIIQIIFSQLSVIVVMALMASLFTALMLTPMLCSKYLKPAPTGTDGSPIPSRHRFLEWVEGGYAKLLEWILDNQVLVVAVMGCVLVASLGLFKFVGTEFMPDQDQGRIVIKYELPTGTRYEVTGEVGRQIVDIVKAHVSSTTELLQYTLRYGRNTSGIGSIISGSKNGSNFGQVELRLTKVDQRERGVKQIIADLRQYTDQLPGVIVRYDAGNPMSNMLTGGGGGFTLALYGHDLEQGMQLANDLMDKFSKIPGLKDLELNQELAQPELQVQVDREKASTLGLNVTDIGATIETYFSGDDTVKYREGGDEYDIVVRLREEDRGTFEDLARVPLRTPSGQIVHLENVAKIIQGVGPTRITRNEQERFIEISGQVYGRGSGDVANDAEKILNETPFPAGFWWKFAGNEEERRKSFLLMIEAICLGMILVYMVMASQFESLLAPFIIFLSIPYGFIGAVMFLALSGRLISIVSLLGFIILVGIVVNNGIVLISYINILLQRRIPLREALVTAGKQRLRPVLSTTLTTIFGMYPMATSTGEGAEIWVPLGMSVIGGLAISTAMTMLFMPVLYSMFSRRLLKTLGVAQYQPGTKK